ncbi:MAG: hypothetical protein HOK20_06040 [Alphaproteobacteria bacterium]|nr:hypothetical protein [Alphaproteobacteria bacterium]MBT5541133.1 hypothetical protein [Alphaproteobacteria bacterium]
MPSDYISKQMNSFSKRCPAGNDFEVEFVTGKSHESQPLSNISADQSENNDERGRIGELLTELTMLSFGYWGHYSKYGTNNGFDGVFIDNSDDPELFLTESKCKERTDGVDVIMRDNLSENRIFEVVNSMTEGAHPKLEIGVLSALRKTGKNVSAFITDTPEKIFKFSHRIKPDGTAQCLVHPFSLEEYTKAKPSPTKASPQDEKALFIKTQLGLVSDSKEEALRLAMSALKLSSKDVMNFFMKKEKVARKLELDSDVDSDEESEEEEESDEDR